jgi:hypothetical protein
MLQFCYDLQAWIEKPRQQTVKTSAGEFKKVLSQNAAMPCAGNSYILNSMLRHQAVGAAALSLEVLLHQPLHAVLLLLLRRRRGCQVNHVVLCTPNLTLGRIRRDADSIVTACRVLLLLLLLQHPALQRYHSILHHSLHDGQSCQPGPHLALWQLRRHLPTAQTQQLCHQTIGHTFTAQTAMLSAWSKSDDPLTQQAPAYEEGACQAATRKWERRLPAAAAAPSLPSQCAALLLHPVP